MWRGKEPVLKSMINESQTIEKSLVTVLLKYNFKYPLVSAQNISLPLHPSTDSNCLISCSQNISAHSIFDQVQHFSAIPMIKYSILRFPSALRLPCGCNFRQCNSFRTQHNFLPWRSSKQNRDIIGNSRSQVGNR